MAETSGKVAVRNGVVLIDMENLFGGYGGDVSTVPVRRIVDEIREAATQRQMLTEFAVLRAYANWSDNRLSVYQREMMEIGIEPVQIFSFAGQVKNAADIELVVDALTLAHQSPTLDLFVIVSGDGGFVPLVRQLHANGRQVMVATTAASPPNKLLRAVADHCLVIGDTRPARDVQHARSQRRGKAASQHRARPQGKGGATKSTAKRGEPHPLPAVGADVAPPTNRDELRSIVAGYVQSPAFQRCLDARGAISLTQLSEAFGSQGGGILDQMKAILPSGQMIFRYGLADTDLGVVRKSQDQMSIQRITAGLEALPPLLEADLAGLDTTLDVLKRRRPPIVIPSPLLLGDLLEHVVELRPDSTDFAELLDTCAERLEDWSAADVRPSLNALVALGLLVSDETEDDRRRPEESSLTLRPDVADVDRAFDALEDAIVDALDPLDWPFPHELIDAILAEDADELTEIPA